MIVDLSSSSEKKMEECLKKVPLFKSLNASDVKEIAEGMGKRSVKKGDVVFKQGDLGDV